MAVPLELIIKYSKPKAREMGEKRSIKVV